MSTLRRSIVVASLALALHAFAAHAEGPPKFDVTTTCSEAAELAGRNKKGCLEDERAAKNTLAQSWSKYKANDTAACVGIVNSGGPASYVELLACLETRREAKGFRMGDSIMQTDDLPTK